MSNVEVLRPMKMDSAYNKERRKAKRLFDTLMEIAKISGEVMYELESDEMKRINNIAHAGLAEANSVLRIRG